METLAQPQPLRILHVEDSEDDHLLVVRALEKAELEVEWKRVELEDDFSCSLVLSPAWGWDAILCDHSLPEFSSEKALEILHREKLDIPFLIVSGAIGEVGVVEAMKMGAHDYVSKDGLFRLAPALLREIQEAKFREEKCHGEEKLRQTMERLKDAVATLSETQAHLAEVENFRALGQIAPGTTRDFNNGLSKIQGICELLLERHPADREILEELQSAVSESTRIVERLQEFHERPPTKGSVDLREVVEAAISLTEPRWRSEAEMAGIEIQLESEVAEESITSGDATELRKALANLIFNSCDALPEGGRIRIKVERRRGGLVLEMEDDGVGMSENVLRRCREPLFTTRGVDGVGLGLGLAESIIHKHGGGMSIESEEGAGTRVTIRLPLHASVAEGVGAEPAPGGEEADASPGDRAAPAEEPDGTGQPMRILLVDDDESIISIFSRLLHSEGHTVIAVRSGDEALEAASREEFDLVITDRAMPVMNGDELCRSLKERNPGLPVIMSSGFDRYRTTEDCENFVDFILPKPINRASLRRAITAVALAG